MGLIDDLGRIPAFHGTTSAQRARIAQFAVVVDLAATTPMPPVGPKDVRFVFEGELELAVCPHEWIPAGHSLDSVLVDAALAGGPPLTAGDLIPNQVGSAPPSIRLNPRTAVQMVVLDAAAIRDIEGSDVWRNQTARWRGLVKTLRITAVLQTGPFRQLGQVERYLLASRMRWRSVAADERLTELGALAHALYVPGPGFAFAAEYAANPGAAPMPLLPYGHGSPVGLAALELGPAGRPWRRRHRVGARAIRGGMVAELTRPAWLALAAVSPKLREFARGQNSIEANLVELATALGASTVLSLP